VSANTDWNKIRIEYITTNASYRELAKIYKLSKDAVGNRGKKEGWPEQRRQHRDKTMTKTLDKDAEKKADKLSEISAVAEEILKKVKTAATEITPEIVIANPQSLRHLTSALKDLKEIMGVKGELELKEQKARLAMLQKQAEKDEDKNNEVRFVLDESLDEFAV
jgi:3-dehydroquinate dehydratase